MNRLPSHSSSTPSTAASSDPEDNEAFASSGGDSGDDHCSLSESEVPSLENSASEEESSDGSSNNDSSPDDSVPPLRATTPRKPRFLRQRNSGINSNNNSNSNSMGNISDNNNNINNPDAIEDGPPAPLLLPVNSSNNSSVPAVIAKDFIPQFLLPQNLNAPIPKGPIRKHSDFERSPYKDVDLQYNNSHNNNFRTSFDPVYETIKAHQNNHNSNGNSYHNQNSGIGRFRSREEIVLHFIMEINMLRRDWVIVFVGVLMQWLHSILTNIAYYYHTQLSAAQRTPLKDIAYEMLPEFKGSWWMVSEYLFLVMIVTFLVSCFSILIIRWNPPHGRPLYGVPIMRRFFMTLTCCQVLRCISFLITTLPGASRQCLYDVPEDMARDELVLGPAHDRGNPEGWAPPITMNDILWRLDATNGCGDLMFSSHTIFTMLFVSIIWRYFDWAFLKYGMLAMQLMMIPFILAARKHYSVDIFTALYVTPLVFEVLRVYFRDQDSHSSEMASHYGIRFHRSYTNEQTGVPTVVMSCRGGEFYVEPADIPLDLQKAYFGTSKLGYGSSNELNSYEDDMMDFPSEFDPVIV